MFLPAGYLPLIYAEILLKGCVHFFGGVSQASHSVKKFSIKLSRKDGVRF